jgi:hypothetical protein
MDIKPTGPGTGLPLSGADEPLNGAPLQQTEALETAQSRAGEPFASVAARFQRSDLQDPAMVEKMLSQCAGELVGSALGRVKGQLPQADTQYLADWLQNDPTIRAKLLSSLERVLT